MAFTAFAERWYDRRWLFVAGLFPALLALGAGTAETTGRGVDELIWTGVGVALIIGTWGCFCACHWFHPEKGALVRGRITRVLPESVLPAVRMFYAGVLVLWFAFGLVGFPLMLASGTAG